MDDIELIPNFIKEISMEPQEKPKKTRKRKIGEIIEKVILWRKYNEGILDEFGNFIQLSLKEAAGKIKIPKKSLDDYYSLIKIGKICGFDFNNNKDEGIGVLRSFIKKNYHKDSYEVEAEN